MLDSKTTETIGKLIDSELISVDIESKDPDLIKKGPATVRNVGHVCGVSLGARLSEGIHTNYLPLNHPDIKEDQVKKSKEILDIVLPSTTPKIGANIIYDVEWLTHEGYEVNGKLHDVQYAEPLLDEYARSYSLASLARKYSTQAKQSNVLKEYNAHMGWEGKPIENLWKMPYSVVKDYATMDAFLPLDIFEKQKMSLQRQNLWELYELETDLIPLMLQMRKQGVKIDIPLLRTLVSKVTEKHYVIKETVYAWSGREFNIGSSTQLAKIFDAKKISYPRNAPTPLMEEKGKPGNPNLSKATLDIIGKKHDIAKVILDYRRYDTLINMFLHPYLNFQVNGRLHCTLHPLKSDDYGTVSGRFSCSKPNLQQVSAKKEDDEEDEYVSDFPKGQIIRSLFIPEEGHLWAKADYSQVEYRIIAHYAVGLGANLLRQQYNDNPKTDFHKHIEDATHFDRRTAKRLNFGGAYGMGTATASKTFGWTMEQAEHFMKTYHNTAPYIRNTRNAVAKAASRRGYIFTLLGRKARLHTSRSLHSMFNRLIQGSAADIMKKALVDCYKKGLFEVLKPHLTVHDELDVSYRDDKEGNEALKEMQETMEQTVNISVPLLVDVHTGKNWSEAD